MMRYAIMYRDEENNWIAEVLSLPGCRSDGATREEALANIKEAIELYLEVLPEDRKELYQEFIEPELVAI
jgi:predicted RNase H-like HicB family nuclease